MKKNGLIILALAVITFSVYLYTAFNGIPWKKQGVAGELEVYIEEKYEMGVTLEEAFYNVKDGNYGATFITDDTPSISFQAEKYKSGTFSDYYVEAVWENEVKKEIEPILAESFPTLSIESYRINPVYGRGEELVQGKDIPSYKELVTGMDVGIHFQNEWTKETEEALIKEGYAFIALLQEKGVSHLGVRMYLEKELAEKRTKNFAVSIEGKDFRKIESEKDMKKYTINF